MLIEHRPTHLN
jgi:hypothetical protein